MQDHIPDALITAFERQYDSSWNDPQLRNERLAMRYGWAAAMEAKQCLYQIQEPTVNHQLTIEREAFGIPQCPFPCGWKNLHTLLVAEGAFLARSLQEDEPITDHQRATVMRVVNYGLEMARAALAVTPAAAPVVLPEPVTWLIERSAFHVSPHGQDAESNEWLEEAHEPGEEGSFPVYTEQQVRALLATGGQAQAQAHAVEQEPFGYFKAEPFGWTDCGPDDEGAVALYERPQAKADAPAPADPSETIKSLPRYTVGRSALDGSMHTFKTEDGPFLRVNEVLEAFAAAKEQGQ